MSLELEYHHAREIWRAMYRSLRGLVRIRADVQAIQHQRSWLKFWTRERLWLPGRKGGGAGAQGPAEGAGGDEKGKARPPPPPQVPEPLEGPPPGYDDHRRPKARRGKAMVGRSSSR